VMSKTPSTDASHAVDATCAAAANGVRSPKTIRVQSTELMARTTPPCVTPAPPSVNWAPSGGRTIASLSNNSPAPGQPSGNAENKRCTAARLATGFTRRHPKRGRNQGTQSEGQS
jgi:hypothetical protein